MRLYFARFARSSNYTASGQMNATFIKSKHVIASSVKLTRTNLIKQDVREFCFSS